VNEFCGRRGVRSDQDVWSRHRAENVLDLSNFLEFAVADFCSEFDRTGFVAFDYEAAAT